MKISVQSYSGYKADERPIKFWVSERPLFVESIEEQWRGTDSVYFRVHADDGRRMSCGIPKPAMNGRWKNHRSRSALCRAFSGRNRITVRQARHISISMRTLSSADEGKTIRRGLSWRMLVDAVLACGRAVH